MKPKLLAFLTWIFYIAQRRTADEIWFFCMIYSAALAVCAYLYRREHTVTTDESKEDPAAKR